MNIEKSPPKSAAQCIAERLYQAGCRHAFGIPGGEVLRLMDALNSAGLRITLVKHENSGGFMAEGTWHADGAPGVLFATIGPGIANAANVIANAWQDRVPMIVLTGCVPALEALTYTHQVFDHIRFLEPITKAAIRVEAGTAAVAIDKAIRIATSGRPGPVVLDVPIDVQQDVRETWQSSHHGKIGATVPADQELAQAATWLGEAERPIMLAGLDVLNEAPGTQVAEFCRAFNVPLLTTYKAKGILPETDPLSLGAAGLSPVADRLLLPLIKQSDCVILAGYDPIEMRTGWQNPFSADQRVIDISHEINTHYMHQAPMNLIGSVGQSLERIGKKVSTKNTWPAGEISKTRTALQEAFHVDEAWGPAAIVDEARRASPENTIATVDSGAHRIVLSHVWRCNEARGLLQSTALCTMGCAVPLAAGRKIAEPDRPVIAFVGDAGLEMFLGELATLRDLKLGVPIVVFVDQQLGLIELKQRGSQMANLGVEFDGTNFTAVADALGGIGVTCTNREELNRAVTKAFDRDTFTLISALIGRNAYDGRI